jgi:hypothetical protein
MLIRRSVRIMLAPVAVVAALSGVAGCGGLSAGDHMFFRLALDASESAASCYPDEMIPESIKDDTSTLRGAATFILYVAGDDEVELDTGAVVLPGDATDDGYRFTGTSEDVDYPAGSTITDADHDGIEDDDDPMVDADMDGTDDETDSQVDTDMDGMDDRFGDVLVDVDNDGKDDRRVEIPSGIKFTKTTKITVNMKVDGSTISGTMTTVTEQKCEGDKCPMNYEKSCARSSTFKGIAIEQAEVGISGNQLPGDR